MRSVSLFFAVCGLLLASAGLARAQAIVLKAPAGLYRAQLRKATVVQKARRSRPSPDVAGCPLQSR